jgi:hypothetical protein
MHKRSCNNMRNLVLFSINVKEPKRIRIQFKTSTELSLKGNDGSIVLIKTLRPTCLEERMNVASRLQKFRDPWSKGRDKVVSVTYQAQCYEGVGDVNV